MRSRRYKYLIFDSYASSMMIYYHEFLFQINSSQLGLFQMFVFVMNATMAPVRTTMVKQNAHALPMFTEIAARNQVKKIILI